MDVTRLKNQIRHQKNTLKIFYFISLSKKLATNNILSLFIYKIALIKVFN